MTGEIIPMLDPDHWQDTEAELWEQEYKQIEENRDQYVEFTGMSSYEAFKVMEDFAESVDDLELKYHLFKALGRPKPFSNFKWQIDNSGPYRQKWFDHRNAGYLRYVEQQIEEYNQLMEQQED